MAKESFSNIQQINKANIAKKALIAIAIMVAVIAVATVLHIARGSEEEKGQSLETAPTPPAVPSEIRYYNPTTSESYETGLNYIIMNQSNGNRIQVNADGTVYLLDENGEIIREYTGDERRNIIESAISITSTDSQANIALSGIEDTLEPIKEPTAEDIRKALESDTISILEDQYGMSLDDFYKGIYDQGLTPDEFYTMLESGTDPELAISLTVASIKEQEKNKEAESAGTPSMEVFQENTESSSTTDDSYPDWLQMPDMTSGLQATMDTLNAAIASSNQSAPSEAQQQWEHVNGTGSKQDWISGKQSVEVGEATRIDKWDLVAGTVIPITLITGLNTDLPGEVVGMVRQNVYDSLTGSNLLIPKGSRVIADYNSSVTVGQKSVQIAWRELITPEGYVYSLPGFQGVDGQGFTGVKDKYKSHFWSILGGAFLGSIINIGTGYIQDQAEAASNMAGMNELSLLSASVIDTSENLGMQYIEQMINRQPTIIIRTGTQTQMLVNQTISFER